MAGRRRLAQQFQGERFLQNDLGRSFGREKSARDSGESIVRPRRVRDAGHHGQVGLVLITEFGNETDVGISLQHVGQSFDLLAGRFIQGAAFGGGGGVSFVVAIKAPQLAARGHDHGIEKT